MPFELTQTGVISCTTYKVKVSTIAAIHLHYRYTVSSGGDGATLLSHPSHAPGTRKNVLLNKDYGSPFEFQHKRSHSIRNEIRHSHQINCKNVNTDVWKLE